MQVAPPERLKLLAAGAIVSRVVKVRVMVPVQYVGLLLGESAWAGTTVANDATRAAATAAIRGTLRIRATA
jgi:hypothetical protein